MSGACNSGRQSDRASVKEEHVSSVSASGRSSGKTIIAVVLVVIAILAIVAGIIYFIFCFGMSRYSLFVERRLNAHRRN